MPTSTTSASPIILTIDPASVRVPSGYGTYRGKLKLTNDGHSALTVTPAVIRMGNGHGCTGQPPAWLTLPAMDKNTFKLAGGQSKAIPYTVHAAPGVNGTGAVLFSAVSGKSADRFGGAVGMRVTVGTGANCTRPYSAPVTHAHGTPVGLVVLVVVLAALLISGVAVAARKLRRGGA